MPNGLSLSLLLNLMIIYYFLKILFWHIDQTLHLKFNFIEIIWNCFTLGLNMKKSSLWIPTYQVRTFQPYPE